MRSKHSRTAPALLLAAGIAAGLSLVIRDRLARRAEAGGDPEERLAALQRQAAERETDCGVWLAYARALLAAGRHEHAAQAFRRALDLNPFAEEAQEGLAIALAEANDLDALYDYLGQWVLTDARLALRLFHHPAIARHTADSRHARLLAEARSQAVD